MKEREFWINHNGKWIKNPSKWIMFKRDIKLWCKKWKLVDKSENKIIPQSEMKRYFSLRENRMPYPYTDSWRGVQMQARIYN